MRTHAVDKLLEQHCYKSAAGLSQLVRFCVCKSKTLAVSNIVFQTQLRKLIRIHNFQTPVATYINYLCLDILSRTLSLSDCVLFVSRGEGFVACFTSSSSPEYSSVSSCDVDGRF